MTVWFSYVLQPIIFVKIIQIAYPFMLLNIGLLGEGGGVVFDSSAVLKWADKDEDRVVII